MSGYTVTKHFAETLDDLRSMCGRHGEAAIAEAEWSAITAWLMHMPVSRLPTCREYTVAALASTQIMRNHDQARLGYPHHMPGAGRTDPLANLGAEGTARTRETAARARSDWEKDGRPYLTRDRIKTTQQYVAACIAKAKAA